MRYNPFQPNKMVAEGMFVGRFDEMKLIDQYFFQTKNENPQHFLLEGERGIGKSSLLFVSENLANGKIGTMEANSQKFNFITISVDLAGVTCQLDIVRAIGRELKAQVSKSAPLKEKGKAAWDFLSKWEVLGVRYHKDVQTDPDDARDELVDAFANLLASGAEIDGAAILIDEADAPPVEARFGEFLKAFTERLARRGCNRVIVCLAGLQNTIPKLRASHESSPRLLSILNLKPLAVDERKDAIRKGLDDATARNGYEVKIADDAINFLAEMSEGYPHFVQQFSYCAFSADTDNHITLEDVLKGAYSENGAIDQLGSKYFNEVYYSKINSDDYRRVLNAMAKHSDGWVTRKTLIAESGVKESIINNALSVLKTRNIIHVDEARQGYYKLPTKSFAAWINAVISVEERRGMGPVSLTEYGDAEPVHETNH